MSSINIRPSSFNNTSYFSTSPVYKSGRVGINTTIPQYPLHIRAHPTFSANDVGITAAIVAELTVTTSFNTSDRRIKTNIINVDKSQTLDILNNVELKKYNYVDTKRDGTEQVYGIIAQQVQEVLPEAVELFTHPIPNIYKKAISHTKNDNNIVIIEVEHSLTNEDFLYPLVIQSGTYEEVYVTIIDIQPNKITVESWEKYNENDNLFIYGQKVNDFHIVDKSKLALINIGATEELYKKVTTLEQTIQELRAEIDLLKNK